MRTFGIEIEFLGDPHSALRALKDTGLACSDSCVDQDDPLGGYWVMKTDGSVSEGGELVSPPLEFSEADRRQVDAAVDVLRQSGCTTSTQAGIHVHVSTQGLTRDQIASTAKFAFRFEDCYFRQGSSGWETMRPYYVQYAHPFTKTDKALMVATDFHSDAVMDVAHQTRYYCLNFNNVIRSGGRQTLEFRVFNSSLNPRRIQSHIALSVATVEAAANDVFKRMKVTPFNVYALGSMADGFRDECSALRAMMCALRGGRRGLSFADRKLISRYWRGSRPQPAPDIAYQLPGWSGCDAVRGKARGLMEPEDAALATAAA